MTNDNSAKQASVVEAHWNPGAVLRLRLKRGPIAIPLLDDADYERAKLMLEIQHRDPSFLTAADEAATTRPERA